jgi:hypothetical protein
MTIHHLAWLISPHRVMSCRRLILRLAGSAIVAVTLLLTVSTVLYAAPARTVAIGGVDGFGSLGDPSATAALRKSGCVRLYVHDFIWEKLDEPTRSRIARTFRGCPPPWIEVGVSSHAEQYWANLYNTYDSAGLKPVAAHANLVSGKNALTEAQWRNLVDVGRSHGLEVIAPIWTPNSGQWKTSTTADPKWDEMKRMASYGGGVTIDAPAWFFLSAPDGYKVFVEDEVRWARKAHIKSTWIFSPPRTDKGNFLADVTKTLNILKKQRALPDDYVVENYMAKPPAGFPFIVGDERTPETVCFVAKWIEQHYLFAR